ncbi:Dyp-type peroxidase [Microbacterium sp. ZW T5_45]|uniref:Dyp-type peroxidase n=1 Tax=Microbacterium sp. ZW T5_45 TaxID=3378080 RepID=UPI0038526143
MAEESSGTPERGSGTTRRGFFLAAGTAAGAAAVAGASGWLLRGVSGEGDAAAAPAPTASASPLPTADHRAGVTYPAVPQRHLMLRVVDVAGVDSADLPALVASAVDALGEVPADAGEVTVTVGYAPEHALALWPERAAAASALPAFARDDPAMITGGDLAVQVCAETASGARDASEAVIAALGGRVLWEQAGYRDAPTPHGTARTSTGFIDGIINPRTPELLAAGVWADAENHDTHLVVRRMYIDAAFTTRPVAEQEQAIGRSRATGAPLSGGGPDDEVDLFSKTADGRLLTPASAHARRAHPTNIGRALMLRRSYSFDPPSGAGLVFIAYVADPQTFVLTQRRLDEMDDLLANTSTDASGCFFVPGS